MTMNEERFEFPDSETSGLKVDKEDIIVCETDKIKRGICPSCDSPLIFQEGCKMCISCGWGGCS